MSVRGPGNASHIDIPYNRVKSIQKFPPYFRFYRSRDVAEILGISYDAFRRFLQVNPTLRTKKNLHGIIGNDGQSKTLKGLSGF